MMQRRFPLAVLAMIAAAALAGCSIHIETGGPRSAPCRYEAERSAAISVGDAARVVVEAGAGSLEITGVEGLAEVKADGKACADSQEALDRIELRAERVGSEVRVIAALVDGFGQSNLRLDLTVEVPAGLPLEVVDTSGTARIQDISEAIVKRVSGTAEVTGVRGNLRLEQSSGEVIATGIDGDVTFTGGSGTAEFRDVGGSVVVTEKTSGTLFIEKVERDVVLERLGSGTVEARDVRGNVTLAEKSSGEIVIERVDGTVELGQLGSGSVEVADVGGSVTLQSKSSGSIDIRSVGQHVLLGELGSGSVDVADVGGDLEIEAKSSGSIDYERIGGQVRVPEL